MSVFHYRMLEPHVYRNHSVLCADCKGRTIIGETIDCAECKEMICPDCIDSFEDYYLCTKCKNGNGPLVSGLRKKIEDAKLERWNAGSPKRTT